MRKPIGSFAESVVVAGTMAGVLSTLVQVTLWLCFTHELPDILYRDTRMAAAIILGPGVLKQADVSWQTGCVASALHFGLSLIYAGAIVACVTQMGWRGRLFFGALSGAAIYVINMYGFVQIFPWFTASRAFITFVAHIAFGMAAATDWAACWHARDK